MRTPPRLGKHQGFMVTSARRAGSQKPTEMPMRGRGSAQAHMGDAGFFVSGRPLGQIFNPPTDSGNRHDQQTLVIGLTNFPLQVGPAASARGASMMANRTTRNVPKIGRSPRIILSPPVDRDTPRRRAASPEGKGPRSEEHTSELQSLMRISYAVFCLNKQT